MRRLAPGPQDLGVFLVHAVRGALIGQVRYPRQDLVSELGGVGLLPQGRLDPRGQILQLCGFLGTRLAPGGLLLVGPQRISVLGVTCSQSTATPSETAIAGLIYVNTLARAGPTSAIRRKKIRNAAAVQTTASPAIESSTLADGTADGQFRAASGA